MTQKKSEKISSELEVRLMTIDDLSPAFHLGEKLFTATRMPNLYHMWDEYEIIDFYHSSSEYCFSAILDEKLVGFLLSTIIEKKRGKNILKFGYLVWTGVDPKIKGHGIGTKLFEKFKTKMIEEKVHTMIVDTQASNTEALKFFYSKGFGHPHDHIYLSMDLSPHTTNGKDKK